MIPPFKVSGVLPPFLGADPTAHNAISPFATSIIDVATRLATTPQRAAILRGLLRYRREMLGLGIEGMQWLAGSYVEDVNTPPQPRDVDVVTFVVRPNSVASDAAWHALIRSRPDLFTPQVSKATYLCDAYTVDLVRGSRSPMWLVQQSNYWFGLFTHRRATLEWKGILAVHLNSPTMDDLVSGMLGTGDAT